MRNLEKRERERAGKYWDVRGRLKRAANWGASELVLITGYYEDEEVMPVGHVACKGVQK